VKTLRRWAGWAILLFLGLILLYQLWIFLHIVWWKYYNPSNSAFMEDRLVVLHEKNPDAKLRHKWIRYDKISLNLKRALVAGRRTPTSWSTKASIGTRFQRAYEKI
jgi:monofunctional biosynthetic peptidoglycan transglycosylase